MVDLSRYDMMTFCQKKTWEAQRACDRAAKATWRETCMYYHPEDGRCDHPRTADCRNDEELPC